MCVRNLSFSFMALSIYTMLVDLTFQSEGEILECDQSNES